MDRNEANYSCMRFLKYNEMNETKVKELNKKTLFWFLFYEVF